MGGIIKTVAFLTVLVAAVALAENYTVGDGQGWRVPGNPNFYSDWASNKTFRAGDVLEFNFQTGNHDVANVSKQAYDSCDTANPTSLVRDGPAKVTLNATGPHYFICTFGNHCSNGQKLSVNVTGANGGGGAVPAPGSPNRPVPPTPAAPPPPPSSSCSLGGSAFLAAIMFSALAFLC